MQEGELLVYAGWCAACMLRARIPGWSSEGRTTRARKRSVRLRRARLEDSLLLPLLQRITSDAAAVAVAILVAMSQGSGNRKGTRATAATERCTRAFVQRQQQNALAAN